MTAGRHRSAGNLRFFDQMKKMLFDEPGGLRKPGRQRIRYDRERGQTSVLPILLRYLNLIAKVSRCDA
jgi:hypothetical protein